MKKEEIFNFYRNYRLYIFPAIVEFSTLILILVVIYPQTLKLIENQKKEEEIQNKSAFLETKIQTLASFDPTDLSQKVDYTLNSYPADKDFVFSLNVLQNLVSQSGFKILSISLELSAKKTNTQSYGIRLDLLGSTSQLPILISSIESSSRLMRVASIETASGKDSSGATIVLNVDILYASAPQEFGSIDSPLPSLSEKDEEVIAKLARGNVSVSSQSTTVQLGPRGKANPFE